MSTRLPIAFPSEKERLNREVAAVQGLSVTERLVAVADTLAATEALALAGGIRDRQLQYHEHCEQEWRQRISAFIARQIDVKHSFQ